MFSADMGSARGQAHRGRARAAFGAVPRGLGAAWRIRSARTATRRSRNFYTATDLQQGRRGHPHDAHHGRPRAVSQPAPTSTSRGMTATAATCEDFVRVRSRTAQGSISAQFRRVVRARPARRKVTVAADAMRATRATLHLAQAVPPTPGQPDKQPMPATAAPGAVRPRYRRRTTASSWSCSTGRETEVSLRRFRRAAGAVDQSWLLRAGGDRGGHQPTTTSYSSPRTMTTPSPAMRRCSG